MKRASYLWCAVLLVMVTGCGAKSGTSAPRRDISIITRDEMVETHFTHAYDLVRSLRPNWLQVRVKSMSNQSAGQPVVYLDGARMGGLDFLRQIPVGQVETAQYLGPTEATSRFGSDHVGGAILVVSRRR